MTSARSGRSRSLVRALRLAVGLVVLVLLAPYALTVLYRFIDPVSTLMIKRRLTGAPVDHSFAALDRIAPVLPLTVLSSEDARFCIHHGVDWKELQDAIDDADDLREARGGSTITQQTVKNLFLWPGRSFVRKALELPLALWMDLVLPKRRVMELYLNVAEWGPTGQFGIESGSKFAFNQSARDLTASEAGLMAAILPNPVRRSAKRPSAGVRRLGATYRARAASSPAIDDCLRTGRTR
jgi:monofunctional biosynthetic peptidoglycan transglycosylase